jgi:transposase
MTGNPCWQAIPTELSVAQFEQFVLPHLDKGKGRRGPRLSVSLHKIFNYILQALYMGCQWKMLPIGKNDKGQPEIHFYEQHFVKPFGEPVSRLRSIEQDATRQTMPRSSLAILGIKTWSSGERMAVRPIAA